MKEPMELNVEECLDLLAGEVFGRRDRGSFQ